MNSEKHDKMSAFDQQTEKQSTSDGGQSTELITKNKIHISKKLILFYAFMTVFTIVAVAWILKNDNKSSQQNESVIDVSEGVQVNRGPSIDQDNPWDHYITSTSREADLKKLTSSLKNSSTTNDVLAILQEYLSNHKLNVKLVNSSIYGKEAKPISEDEIEHLKTFGVVLIDEIYKYPNEIFNTIDVNTVLLSSGALTSGNRYTLYGLADFENSSLIYNATPLLTESNGRQQFNPTWEKYVRQLIQHEIGHFTHFQIGLTNSNYPGSWGEWSKLNKSDFSYLMSCENANPLAEAAAPIPEGFVTANATTCPAEDWADTYAVVMGESGIAGTPRDSYFEAKKSFIESRLLKFQPSFEEAFQ